MVPTQIYKWLSTSLRSKGVDSWGDVLDAGTGRSSICWIVRHNVSSVDAVTHQSSGGYSQRTVKDAAQGAHVHANVILGNWKDATLLAGRQYDVVVADFLVRRAQISKNYN